MPELFPYQVDGVRFLLGQKRCLLADEPGLGKTAQALTALKAVSDGNRKSVCIITPKTAVFNWVRELQKWNVDSPYKMLITNFEQIVFDTPDREVFLSTPWDIVIVDEAHKLKNSGARRTQDIYRHAFRSPYVWLLTGTPARNHAGELWTHIRALRPDMIMTKRGEPMTLPEFENKYCRIKFHGNQRRIAGSKNIGELRKIMEDGGFFLRRRKREVQKDLPDLTFDLYPLPMAAAMPKDMAAHAVRNYAKLKGLQDDELMDVIRKEGDTLAFSSMMRLTGMLKAKPVAEMAENELDAPGKIIIFYKHTDVGDALSDLLPHHCPARVDGKTKDVEAEVVSFQEDPKCRVFLGQITSCAEAINLTAANQVIFAEASWSPSDNVQAASRAHRIGMQDNLIVRFTCLQGSLDEVLMGVLERKTNELHQLFG